MLEQYLFESCELEVHKKCTKIGTEHTQKFPTAQFIDENKVPSFTIRIQPFNQVNSPYKTIYFQYWLTYVEHFYAKKLIVLRLLPQSAIAPLFCIDIYSTNSYPKIPIYNEMPTGRKYTIPNHHKAIKSDENQTRKKEEQEIIRAAFQQGQQKTRTSKRTCFLQDTPIQTNTKKAI